MLKADRYPSANYYQKSFHKHTYIVILIVCLSITNKTQTKSWQQWLYYFIVIIIASRPDNNDQTALLIIMDELISIIQQRRNQIHTPLPNDHTHKSQLIELERKRTERQNWILRVVKTIKVPVLQQKKIIIDTILKIMNFYQSMPNQIENIEHISFTEAVINLFVQFYNKFDEMDLSHIRTIIRPNNSYIIVDLIKSVIDLSRKQFKTFLQHNFKESVTKRPELKNMARNQVKTQESRSIMKTQPKIQEKTVKLSIKGEMESSLQQGVSPILHQQIQSALFQKYNKSIQNFNIQASHQRFNSLYFDLLYLNQKNAHKIQKYMDSCFGAKRHINYDVTGLYTVQQIKNIKREKEERATSRIADLRDLNQNCTSEQLKEYFKMKVELHESMNSFPCFKKSDAIRSWFPIVCVKNGDRLHPYDMMVEVNESKYLEIQFQQKYNKKLKGYIKDLLVEHYNDKELFGPEDPEMLAFNKKAFLDFNNSKLIELVTKEAPRVAKWEAENERNDRQAGKIKQKMFPPIPGIYNPDLNSQTRAKKSKSETKLPNATMVMYSDKQKNGNGLRQILQKRLNYSSFVNDMQVSSRKMNSIISNILRSKQLK